MEQKCPRCGVDQGNMFGKCWRCELWAWSMRPPSAPPIIGLRPLGDNRFAVIRESDMREGDHALPIDDND